jgi:hypothetical protein
MPRLRIVTAASALAMLAVVWPARDSGARAQDLLEYRDPERRFVFTYPSSFGTPERGTDSGFGDRIAAVRFSRLSTGGIGGEAVLDAGRPALDVLAAGGLYDAIAAGALPAAIAALVQDALPRLSPATVCEQIGREQHIDAESAPFAGLTARQRTALADLDRMGNHAPRVASCAVDGDVATFDKDAGMTAAGPRRRTYGAVRFLGGRYASFQLVRAGGAPDTGLIEQMRQVVSSFRLAPDRPAGN